MKNSQGILDHVNFTVNNFNASVDWYKRVFHFDLVEEGVNKIGKKWGILRNGNNMLAISEYPDRKVNECENYHRMNHFGIRLVDTQEWEETLKREKVQIGYGIITYPNSKSWYVLDPTGNEIEVSIWKDNTVRF